MSEASDDTLLQLIYAAALEPSLWLQAMAAIADGRDLAGALENAPDAMFLLDAAGRVRLANPPAQRLLAQGKGLAVLGGRLTAEPPDAARRLEALIAAATAQDGPRSCGDMSLALDGHRFPLAISVTPLGADQPAPIGRAHSAVVCVIDLGRGVSSPQDKLRTLFGLTQAEARIASAVFEGLSLREAAKALKITFNTARSHYARIYEKTGVTRQAELVVMMMRLSEGPGYSG